jgi:hypothetical protein
MSEFAAACWQAYLDLFIEWEEFTAAMEKYDDLDKVLLALSWPCGC